MRAFSGYAPPVKTGGTADLDNPGRSFPSTTAVRWSGTYDSNDGTLQVQMTARASNVAMALRQLGAAQVTAEVRISGTWSAVAVTTSVTKTMSNDGSVTLSSINVALPYESEGTNFRITMNIADHPLLDPTDPTTGWFVRNEWYKLVYYAIAPNHAASGTAPRSCNDTTPTCLQVTSVLPANKQRAILILAGRSLTGQARPNGTLTDFLEGANADLDLAFEQRTVNSSFNDRVVVVDANP